ncbi:asparaginase [Alkalicoccus daliensis]|uniref:asparaginase n=1 Tax=Alkalicoccus daliensis TaxID=745820 RepID=A0A1H0AWT7_9BACI|nr:asparaginase [Alkalicoccus daliensis]SDN37930.1 L-asparaginase [Alkalicoccus daliensis]
MKKVLIISTGGTIASTENAEGKLEAGKYSGDELAAKLGIPEDIEVDILSALQKPSVHISIQDLDNIKKVIEEKQNYYDGIVITHGTDTLEESAYYLDLITNYSLPIVVTGSQRSPDALGSDAYINLRHAIYTASSQSMKDTGVTVVFNERIFSAQYVKKEHASNIQGFNAFGFGYLGIIDNDKIHLYQKPVRREFYDINENKPAHVVLIKCHMDSTDLFIRASIEAAVDGIILEGLGRGQVHPSMMEKIEEAIQQGIPVVITTASEEGHVYTTYDYVGSAYDLFKKGVIMGRDYDAKKARIKLIACLRAEKEIYSAFNY